MSSLAYRPEVDGLRTFAVLPVLVFHLGASWLPGGFLGVDVFFVISGYLITSLIMKDLAEGTFTLRGFWARRIRRIMPALLTVVLFFFAAAALLVFRPQVESIAFDGLSASLSYANFQMLFKFGDYWGPVAESSPFLHAWSLSVEEQFYLLYPLVLLLLFKMRAPTGRVLLVAGVLSFAFFAWLSTVEPNATFYLLPTRAWELLAGGFAAFSGLRISKLVGEAFHPWLTLLGLLAMGASYLWVDGSQGVNVLSAIAVVGALLVILFSRSPGWGQSLLAWKPTVFVGKISYSLYLWHWPVIIYSGFLAMRYQIAVPKVGMIAIVFVLATLSYFLVEQPLRKSPKGVLVSMGMLLAVLISTFGLLQYSAIPYDTAAYRPVEYYGSQYDVSPPKPAPLGGVAAGVRELVGKRAGVIAPKRNPAYAEAYRNGGIPGGTATSGARADVLVLGDSHAAMWGKTVDEICTELGVPAAFYSVVGDSPFFEIPLKPVMDHTDGFTDAQFHEFASSFLSRLENESPRVLIVATSWNVRLGKGDLRLENLLKFATSRGTKVILMEDPPVSGLGDNNTAQVLTLLAVKPEPGRRQAPVSAIRVEATRKANSMLHALAQKVPGTVVFPVFATFYEAGHVVMLDGSSILYLDDDHLSYQGASLLKSALKLQVATLLAPEAKP